MEHTSSDEPESAEVVLLEDRVLTGVRIAAELVTLVWILDIATHGEMSNGLKWKWQTWKSRRKAEKDFQNSLRHVFFEAMFLVESAWRNREHN